MRESFTDCSADSGHRYVQTGTTKTRDLLSIFEQSGLAIWARADNSTGDPASAAADLSGNGLGYAQATAGKRPAMATGVNGLPAWNFSSASQSGLVATGLSLAANSRPCSFVVAQSTGAQNNLPSITLTGSSLDAGVHALIVADALSPAFPGFVSICFLSDGASGIVQSAAAADHNIHLLGGLCDPGGYSLLVDRTIVSRSTKVGGLLIAKDTDYIGFSDAIYQEDGFDGLVYERWITTSVPTATQWEWMLNYVHLRYGLA